MPAGLAVLANPRYRFARHIRLLNSALVDVAVGKIRKLIVMMPPRHGKSELVSKIYPAWYLCNYPDRRVILATYEADFAASWGRRARQLVEEWGPRIWGVTVDPRSNAADRWDIEGRTGGMVCAGIGGPITGRGAHVLIIEDPIKNAEEAQSATYRDKAWEWYQSTAYTRLESDPPGAVVVVMTRWHEDDLVGRILAHEPGGWHVIRLPALAEEDDPLGRQPGEPLWPERFPAERLEEIKRTIGTYWWNALYQQRPSPPEGALVRREWLQFYDRLPDKAGMMFIQSWDMTFKQTQEGSYVVGQVWAQDGADCYLVDQVRGRWDFVETIRAIRSLSACYPKARAKLIEETANGPAVIASLKREIEGLIPIAVRDGKETRLVSVVPLFEAGNVYLPKNAPWIDDYIEELVSFPHAAHNDQVDATSQALNYLISRRRTRIAVGGERTDVVVYRPR